MLYLPTKAYQNVKTFLTHFYRLTRCLYTAEKNCLLCWDSLKQCENNVFVFLITRVLHPAYT